MKAAYRAWDSFGAPTSDGLEGYNEANGAGKGTGLSAAQMHDQNSFQTWDFIKFWKMIPNKYPSLKWLE